MCFVSSSFLYGVPTKYNPKEMFYPYEDFIIFISHEN